MIPNIIVSTTLLDSSSLPHAPANSSSIQNALGITFGIVGAVSFLMITIAGLRYVLSSGDPQKISRAKNSIIYALVGLAIALAAESIVYFVIGNA